MEKVTVYFLNKDSAFRKVTNFLDKHKIKYNLQNINKDKITWEQLIRILMHTDNGVEDILSTRSKDYKYLVSQGIDFTEITLTEFQKLLLKYPKVLKLPITFSEHKVLAGFDDDEMTKFKNKEDKKRELETLLI